MGTLFKCEWKNGLKSTCIWTFLIGGLGLICLLLYKSMEGSAAEMAESFASMGAFSDAFGMSTLSIATVNGYFATEIGTIHSLGSGMFAASIATNILSKEEDGHTADFTYVLPISRKNIFLSKLLYILINLIFFTVLCALFYLCGFILLNEKIPYEELVLFMLTQFLMNIVISGICLIISAFSRKNKLGTGIGISLMFYAYDLTSRIVPDLEKLRFLSPYSFSNASELFSQKELYGNGLICGIAVLTASMIGAFIIHNKKDLSC